MEFLQPQIDQGVLRGSSADITSNLTAHLLFNDDATDSSGNSNDFTAVNTPTYATGIKGNAIDLEKSSSQYVERASFGPSGDFSVCCWVKPESQPANFNLNAIVARYDGSSDPQFQLNYSQFLGDFRVVGFVNTSSGSVVASHLSTPLSNGTWYHLALTFSANDAVVTTYVNGDAESFDGLGTLNAGTGPMRVGANGESSAGQYWDGLIDEFRYYDRALTAADVATLYGGGTPP